MYAGRLAERTIFASQLVADRDVQRTVRRHVFVFDRGAGSRAFRGAKGAKGAKR